jgi:hypothetical protein
VVVDAVGEDGDMLLATAPRSAVFDLLLIGHVLIAFLSVVVLVVTYATLADLGKATTGAPWPAGPARFFRPGPEIGGRLLWLLPVTGFALLASSHGDSSLRDTFVQVGIGCWLLAVLVAELRVFPALKALRGTLQASTTVVDDEGWRAAVGRARWGIDGVVLALLVGAVVMLVQP